MLQVLILVAACFEPLALEVAEPAEVVPGQAVTLRGTGFPEEPTVSVERDGARVGLEVLGSQGSRQLEVRIPPTLHRGSWTVHITAEDQASFLADGLSVVLPPTDRPCAGTHTTHSRVSVVHRSVVIETIYGNGERDRHDLGFDEVEALEVEQVPTASDRTCSAIWVRTIDGRRLILADDDAVDLAERARLLGGQLERPVRELDRQAPHPIQ